MWELVRPQLIIKPKHTDSAEDVNHSIGHPRRLILSYRSQLCNLSSEDLRKFKRTLSVEIQWACAYWFTETEAYLTLHRTTNSVAMGTMGMIGRQVPALTWFCVVIGCLAARKTPLRA